MDLRTGKNGMMADTEPESRRYGQAPGQAEAGAEQRIMAGVPEDFQRRIMRIRSWRRSLSVPTENRSAAIRREMPWARERTETGVQTSRATGQAAARIQTAQVRAQAARARERAAAVPGHRDQTARTGKTAGEQERQTQVPGPVQRKNIF